jgi:methanogenic corrinoid protein MtbC1
MGSASRAESAPRSTTVRGDAANIIAFPEREPGPASLIRLVEQEIIPRLLLSHSRVPRRFPPQTGAPASAASPLPAVRARIEHAEVSRFAQAAVTEDADVLIARLNGWRARGFDDQALCLELLAPAAKLLGFMWEEDLCGFNDVTVGLVRLQQVLHALPDPARTVEPDPDRNALFATVPGEQHAFGLQLAADAFRRRGWRVTTATETDAQALLRQASVEVFDLVGLSAVQDCDPVEIRDLISSLRLRSLNPDVRIVVGGRLFDLRPDLVLVVGADGGGEDSRASVDTAERLVSKRVGRP